MRRVLALSVGVAAACTALVSTATPRVAAATFTFVDGPSRIVLDTSMNGRYVLVGQFPGGGASVIDRTTGSKTVVDGVGGQRGSSALSGDGRHVVFISTERLVPSDTDDLGDVYRRTVSTGALSLMTPGQPFWEFSEFVDTTTDGSRIVARGSNNSLANTAAFVADGSATTELGTGLGEPTGGNLVNGSAIGISADGRFVMYLSNRGTEPGLFRDDLTTGTRIRTNPPASGGLRTVMSADGSTLATVEFGTKTVYRAAVGSPLAPIGTVGDPSSIGLGLSISGNGAVVTWLQNSPTDVSGFGTVSAPQVVRWTAAGGTQLASGDPPTRPNGDAADGLVTDDGSLVFLTTRATNLAGGTRDQLSVIARTYGPSAPDPVTTTTTTTTTTAPNTTAPAVPPTPGVASAYTARTPVRVLDTRIGLGAPIGLPAARTTITVPVRGAHDVPENASAVAIQVAAAEGDGIGFVSLTPSGAPPGVTANLNVDAPGKVVANMAVVPIGTNGAIDVFVQAHTHVIVDLLGWWTPSAGAVSAGRYVAVGPSRVLDTRPATAVNSDGTKPTAQGVTTVQIAGRGGVPATGVRAVAINLAAAETDDAGFVQAAPADALVPGASSTLNISQPGQVVSAATIVPVDAEGRIAVYTMSSTHLIVDVAGWFTDGTASPGTSGLFVPWTPVTRVLDTRPGGVGAPASKPVAGARLNLPATGSAIVGNLAVTETDAPGFVQLGPSASMVNGATANINPTGAGNTISNAFIAPMDAGLGIFTYGGTHIVIDIAGYMTSP